MPLEPPAQHTTTLGTKVTPLEVPPSAFKSGALPICLLEYPPLQILLIISLINLITSQRASRSSLDKKFPFELLDRNFLVGSLWKSLGRSSQQEVSRKKSKDENIRRGWQITSGDKKLIGKFMDCHSLAALSHMLMIIGRGPQIDLSALSLRCLIRASEVSKVFGPRQWTSFIAWHHLFAILNQPIENGLALISIHQHRVISGMVFGNDFPILKLPNSF